MLPAARNLELIGPGQTSLEDDLRAAAAQAGQRVDPEPSPEAGWYFRSDHYPFAQRGVPALAFRAGRDLVGRGRAAGSDDRRLQSGLNTSRATNIDPRWTSPAPRRKRLPLSRGLNDRRFDELADLAPGRRLLLRSAPPPPPSTASRSKAVSRTRRG